MLKGMSQSTPPPQLPTAHTPLLSLFYYQLYLTPGCPTKIKTQWGIKHTLSSFYKLPNSSKKFSKKHKLGRGGGGGIRAGGGAVIRAGGGGKS